jgi:hypothetical protein
MERFRGISIDASMDTFMDISIDIPIYLQASPLPPVSYS